MTLLIKLLLVPALIAAVTYAGRRWGQGVAGWLGSFPIVAGPILLILTLENGAAFGSLAARHALLAISATMTFFVTYARLADRLRWHAAMPLALACWIGVAVLVSRLPSTLPVALTFALVALAVSPAAMGRRASPYTAVVPHRFELPARMACGAALTVATSALGRLIGAEASGYAALFPVVGGVVAGFAHATQGAAVANAFLFGMTRGMWSVAVFCTTLTLLLPRVSIIAAFGPAVAATVLAHALLKPSRPSPRTIDERAARSRPRQ